MIKKPVIFMFSGQGSQYFFMGKELFKRHPIYRKWMLELNDIAYDIIGESIIDYIYDENKKSDIFDHTFFSNPAIAMVEYALAQTLIESGIEPDYVLGASLGEFVAAAVSGIMKVEELLIIVIKLAEIVENYCMQGSMLAILEDVSLYEKNNLIFRNSELAAVNFHSHFVISGATEKLNLIECFLREKNIAYHSLPISQSFHSSLMDPAELTFMDFIKQEYFKSPRLPLISCSCGKTIDMISNDHFWMVVRKPVLFQTTIHELEKEDEYIYLDIGPSGTLATFVKYNLSEDSGSRSLPILTPYGYDFKNLEIVRAYFSK